MFSNDEEAEISQRNSKESVEEGSSSHLKSKEEGKTTQEAASKQQNGSSSDVESLQQNELIEKQSHFFFSQIFTDEDVITLLQGQIDFKSEHGDESKTEFHLFVKGKLHMEFTKLQVTEKLRRLKQKFLGNFNSKKQAPLEFFNAYEYTVFKLSEKLWGNEEDEVDVDVESNYPLLPRSFQMNIGGIISSDMLKTIWAMMGSDKAQHFEAEWRKLMIQELELHLKETELVLKVLKG
ncbi:probable transcription factor At1g61730 [Olea europaea subsp. europaea]|uniref:Probable transcription factor At1g61730 n=1 Tax=Olea europaea subsp. europaea TaxID=158383 RepID=A0A8S0QAC1_OLEEU|nr:probable transcription factor At1g61730 [Olea europaea subsp. europaea]